MNFEPDTEEVIRMHIKAQQEPPSAYEVIFFLVVVVAPAIYFLDCIF
jgi:hypothetical protein